MSANDPRLARFAGLLYLVIIATGLTAEFVLRAPLTPDIAPDLAAAILRQSAMGDAVMILADVGLAIALFLLFRMLAPGIAIAAMVFRLVQAAILAGGLLILLAGAEGWASAADTLALHAMAYDVGLLFFGVNSLLTALLVMWAGGAGRFIGPALGAAGVVYVIGSTLRILAPDLVEAFQPAYLIAIVAELAFCIWLLLGAPRPVRIANA